VRTEERSLDDKRSLNALRRRKPSAMRMLEVRSHRT